MHSQQNVKYNKLLVFVTVGFPHDDYDDNT